MGWRQRVGANARPMTRAAPPADRLSEAIQNFGATNGLLVAVLLAMTGNTV